jgi:hypothetical protein
MADERLRMTAEMQDKLSGPLRRIQQQLMATGRMDGLRRLSGDMGRLEQAGYRLGRVLGTTLRVGVLATAGAATVASAAMIKFGKDSAASLDELGAFAGQVDFSADALRTLQGAADRYNVSQDALRGGIEKLHTNLGRLKNNQGGFYTYLQKTNPALATQLKHTRSTEDAYVALFGALEKIKDPAKRAALVKAAGIGQESLRFLADGPDGLRNTIGEVKKLQGVLGDGAYKAAGDFGDAMDNIGLALRGLNDKLTASILPTLTPLLQDLAQFIATNRDGIAAGFRQIATDVATGIKTLLSPLGKMDRKDWLAFWNDLKGIAAALGNVASVINEVAQAMGGWKVVIGSIVGLKLASWFKGLAGDVTNLLPNIGGPAGSQAGGKSGPAWWAPIAQALIYQQGKDLMMKGLNALPRPTGPNAIADPENFDPWADLKRILGGWTQSVVKNRTGDLVNERTAQIEEKQSQLADANSIISEMQKSGNDKRFPDQFERVLRMRRTIEAQLSDLRAGLALLKREAADIGKEIGKKAGESFFDSIRPLFQRSSYSGGGDAGANGGVVNAAYRPMAAAKKAVGAAFGASSQGPGVVPKNMAAGADRAMQLLMQNGFSREQAAALAGNIQQESGFNPNALNKREGAHGILQWRGSRWQALQRFAATRGANPNTLETQVAFIREELTNPALGEAQRKAARSFLRAGNIGAANRALKGYIRYGDNSFGTRGSNAEAIMRRDRKAQMQRHKIDGAASVNIRVQGLPSDSKTSAKASGLFREVNLDTGRSMKPAM